MHEQERLMVSMLQEEIVARLTAFADNMLAYGTDRHGEEKSPMFVCGLCCRNHSPLERSPDLPGQRVGDRSWFGTNLMYDLPLLRTFLYLSEYTGDPRYRRGVEDYLAFFARRCPDPATGLFPWGEHTYWHHFYDRAYTCGGEYQPQTEHCHDHLRAAPAWFWELMRAIAPEVVVRFGDGLTGHLRGYDDFNFSRHATMGRRCFSPGGFQFPRHAGFYVVDWAQAYLAAGATRFLEYIDGIVKYLLMRRSPANGLLLMCDEGNMQREVTRSQTASFALSLAEVCQVLAGEADERITAWHAGAQALASAVAAAVADEDMHSEFFAFAAAQPSRADVADERRMPVWYSSYGVNPLSFMGLLCNGLYRHFGDPRLLTYSRRVAECYMAAPLPFPRATARRHDYSGSITAHDLALCLDFVCDMMELAPDSPAGDMPAILIPFIDAHMFENGYIRAASDFPYYDGQADPGRLAYALLRYATTNGSARSRVTPDYQAR